MKIETEEFLDRICLVVLTVIAVVGIVFAFLAPVLSR
jgi:hypothetical protein